MYSRYWRNKAPRWAGSQGYIRLIVSDKSKANKSKANKSKANRSKANTSKANRSKAMEEPALQRACLTRSSQAQAHMPRETRWLIDPLAINPILL